MEEGASGTRLSPDERDELKYGFVCEPASRSSVNLLCRQLDVKRSAYYERSETARPGQVILPVGLALRRGMKELFAASWDSLGSWTMMKNLREEGFETAHVV